MPRQNDSQPSTSAPGHAPAPVPGGGGVPPSASAPAAGPPVGGAPVVAPAARRRSRRPFLILGLVAVLVLGGIAALRAATAGEESTDDAQVAADVVPVGSRVAGLVLAVHVKENQEVKRGDLLIEIDPADYAARVDQAAAELATATAQAEAAEAQVQIVEATSKGGLVSARAALLGTSAGVEGAEAQVAVAQAAVARVQADARKADLELARAKELRQANAAPQERLDLADSAAEAAHAALKQAQAQVVLAEQAKRTATSRVNEARGRVDQSAPIAPQMAAARAGVDLAHARVQSAEAALKLAKLQLGYTRVIAPADGVASKLMVHDGQLVVAGQPVAQLVPDVTYVVANFKETQIGRIHPAQRATIRVDAYPGRTFEGRVESLSGGTGASFSLLPPDNASGNFVKVVERVPVRVAWVNPPSDLHLRAGLSSDVTVRVEP